MPPRKKILSLVAPFVLGGFAECAGHGSIVPRCTRTKGEEDRAASIDNAHRRGFGIYPVDIIDFEPRKALGE